MAQQREPWKAFLLNKGQIDMIHGTLLEVLKQAEKGDIRSKYLGICRLWAEQTERQSRTFASIRIYEIVSYLAQDWEFSAYPRERNVHPVPLPTNGEHHWEGAQLVYRLDLIRYILKRLRDWKRRAA